jgi:phospho-N-acetylmuramoyl-pentapeptide-transferase
MLYNLLTPLADEYIFFNLFRYLTFRTGGAIMTALIICFVIGPGMIKWLRSKQTGASNIREYLEDVHMNKAGTPTMGGLMILVSVAVSTLLWADLSNLFVWTSLLVMIGYGLIGFTDDYLKLTKKNSKGLSGKIRLLGQVLIGLVATIIIINQLPPEINMHVAVPFFKNLFIYLSWFFIPWALLVMVGSANAVNLTDGLDGLAIVPVAIAAACFGLISYLVGNSVFSEYLQIPYVAGTGELAILCGALVGASMGFLWFNAPPAMVFMGGASRRVYGVFMV